MERTNWLLTAAERDNPATVLDSRHGPDGSAWTEGNDVRVLVHGSTPCAGSKHFSRAGSARAGVRQARHSPPTVMVMVMVM